MSTGSRRSASAQRPRAQPDEVLAHPPSTEHNPTGAQLTFSSPAADPDYVSVPLREQ